MQIGTQDFCMEAWIKLRTQGVNYERYITHQASWAQGGVKGVEFAASTTGDLRLELMIDGSSATDFSHSHQIVKERWYHAVITRESGHARAFIDGVMKNNAANTTNINGSGGTHFGTNTAGTDQMDDFLIRDFRLCIGGVPTDYSTTSTTNDATIFSVPNAHITKTSQGATASEVKALLFNTPYVQDNSDNTNASLTYHSKGQTIPDGPYDTLEYTAAAHGSSLRLDGSDDQVRITVDNSTMDIGSAFTIECWFYYDNFIADASICQRGGGGGAWNGTDGVYYGLSFYNNKLNWIFQHSAGSNTYMGTTGLPLYNQWNHVAVSYDGTTTALFLNGVRENSSTASYVTVTNRDRFVIGTGQVNNWAAHADFVGNIADFRISNSVRYDPTQTTCTVPTASFTSDSDTGLLIKGGDAGIIDKAQGAQSILLQGDAKCSTEQTKFLSTSMKFDGNDRINIGVLNDNGGILAMRTADFTWEAWVYIGSGNTSYHQIFSSRPSNTGGTEQGSLAVNPSGGLTFYVGAFVIDYTTSIGTGSWKHIAVVRDGSNCRLFIDGTQVAINTSFTSDMSRDDFTLGANYNGTEAFTGYLSDVRVTKGLARYTSNFTPPTAALQG